MSRLTTPRESIPNKLLAALPVEDYTRLRRVLDPVTFTLKYSLAVPGEPISHVYFPSHGVMSLLIPLSGGQPMEVAMVGNEGMVGIHAYLGRPTAPFIAFCQVPGAGFRIKTHTFLREVKKGGALCTVLNHYLDGLLIQMAVAGGCNRLHTVEQRCARWLLMTQDRVAGSQFVLTQEFLAVMLGIRRAGVNEVATTLKKAGLIHYSRGVLTVLDRDRLERITCDCYKTLKTIHERLLTSPA